MRKIFLVLIVGISVELNSSCYFDHLEGIHPLDGFVDPCDPALPDTYTGTVQYIMGLNCVSCHSVSKASGNIKLDSYIEVKAVATSGLLLNAIQRKPGVKPMPPSQAIDNCQVLQVTDWINAGFPQ